MELFIYNMDRNNNDLITVMDNLLIKKVPTLDGKKVQCEVISKNNGYYIQNCDENEALMILSSIKMVCKGYQASWWIQDYTSEFKFVTLRHEKIHEFKKFPVKKEISKIHVNQDTADSLKSALTSGPKKEFKKLEKIKIEDLNPSENFTFNVKFNPDKPFSMATVNSEKKLIKIPEGSWIKITGTKFQTNNEEIKNILIGKGFEYNEENLPSAQ